MTPTPEAEGIEETHSTREIEELKKEFIAEYKAGHKEGGMRSYLFTGQNGSLIADWWIEKLHHQLQKAREEWLREEIEKLEGLKQWTDPDVEGMKYTQYQTDTVITPLIYNAGIDAIIDRYTEELDQEVNNK